MTSSTFPTVCQCCFVRPLDPNTGDEWCLQCMAADDAQQEALTDTACYCDWEQQCTVCAREEQTRIAAALGMPNTCRCGGCAACDADYEDYLKQQEAILAAGNADTTLTVVLTPEQQALFDAECDDLPF